MQIAPKIVCKGQLISEQYFGVFKSPKKPTKFNWPLVSYYYFRLVQFSPNQSLCIEFFELAILNFSFQKKNVFFFLLHLHQIWSPWKSVKIYRLEWMRPNFDDYRVNLLMPKNMSTSTVKVAYNTYLHTTYLASSLPFYQSLQLQMVKHL